MHEFSLELRFAQLSLVSVSKECVFTFEHIQANPRRLLTLTQNKRKIIVAFHSSLLNASKGPKKNQNVGRRRKFYDLFTG